MGILDTVLSAIGTNTPQAKALSGINELIQQNGGLDGVLGKLKSGGLTEAVSSWISTGPNQAIAADKIVNALGPDMVAKISEKTGVPVDTLKQHLADTLPKVVDQLSPNGALPSGGVGADQILKIGMSLLSKQ